MIILTQIKDIELLKPLYNGNHLNTMELKRIEQLLFLLNQDFKNRTKQK